MHRDDPTSLAGFIARLPGRARSFAERGLAVPFTTPPLAAARFRRSEGGAPELLLPALGGRGTYVLGWEAALRLTGPTLHDRALWPRVAGLARPDPGAVRAAARATAMEGFAGRAARTAALEAASATAEGLPAGDDPGAPIATRLAELAALAEAANSVPGSEVARLVARAARLAIAAARACLRPLPGLAETEAVRRADWLLDGWRMPAAAVLLTPAERREAALSDLLAALPVPPLEAEAWSPSGGAWEALLLARDRLPPLPAWPEGARVDVVVRLERARALAA